MVTFLICLLALQGPKELKVPDESKILPPLVVPAGTTIPVSLVSRISTKHASPGDGVYARTVFPVTVSDKIVIPVGSFVRGKIAEVERPGRVKGKPELTITFQSLILPSGRTLDIYATLGSVGDSGRRKGESSIEGDSSKGQDAATIGSTAAQGAVIGAIGARGKGAAVGAGVGAAAGAAAVLLTRGKDVVLEAGTTLEIVLDRRLEP